MASSTGDCSTEEEDREETGWVDKLVDVVLEVLGLF